jgi:hypothetical protein
MLDLEDENERIAFAHQVESESIQKALDVLKFSRDSDIIEKMNLRLSNL